jgi:hypothetical protein
MSNLAALLFETGDREAATKLLSECLAGRRSVLGESHPTTIATADQLKLMEATRAAKPPSRED